MKFWSFKFYGNPLDTWVIAVSMAVFLVILLKLIKAIMLTRFKKIAERTKTVIDDLLVEIVDKTKLLFLIVISCYIASLTLFFQAPVRSIIQTITIITIILQFGVWANYLFQAIIKIQINKRMEKDDASAKTTFTALNLIGKFVLWSVVLLLVLDNLGVEITTLIAGLGIGGLAVALALQNILGDLFASLSIMLDRPFEIGDFIIMGDYLGAVEKIGIKTTRIRSLSGEQIIISNNDLLNSRIRNYKRMMERRVLFTLGVIYQTTYDQLVKIPQIIEEIINSIELVRFDRAHFKEYGDFALIFEVVYYVKSPDYNTYMDVQQKINLEIYKKFKQEGIEFAYPSQTLFLKSEESEFPVRIIENKTEG
ncbi:mechanosensitive ion channel family protein [bacterium]|nr:MAG: mechanosensitive ion channel family protein [bacterium]